MTWARGILLGCTVLATSVSAVLQERPQRVERVTEFHWCETDADWTLEEETFIQIEGATVRHDVEKTDVWTQTRPGAPPALPPPGEVMPE